MSIATSKMGIPEYYVTQWYKEMTEMDWTQTNGHRVNDGNWKAVDGTGKTQGDTRRC